MLEAAGQAEYLGPLHTSGRCDGWWGSLARLRALRWGCVADVQAIRAYWGERVVRVTLTNPNPNPEPNPNPNPNQAIRAYWGERVAFYFAWQSFYLQALTLTLTLTSNP